MLGEFDRRTGDPNTGGSRPGGVVTSYRQEAERCAGYLFTHGPTKGAAVAAATDVPKATQMMRSNVYGWFQRIDQGIYDLSDDGRSHITEGR